MASQKCHRLRTQKLAIEHMSQAAEKQRCCNAPQINTYGPINIYFQPAPAPPPTEGPKSLFATNAERIKRTSVMKGKKGKQKPHSVLVWQSMADGTIKAGCHHCKKHFVDLAHFAPMDGTSRTQGARNKFDAAYAAYQAAHAAGDRDECIAQRGILESLRCAYCFECRKDKGYLSPAMKECKDYYDTMRKTMAKRHNGCQNPDCPERGEDVWCVLTADHGTNPKKRDKNDELVNLSNYSACDQHWAVFRRWCGGKQANPSADLPLLPQGRANVILGQPVT